MQVASFLCGILLFSVSCLDVPRFSSLFHKEQDFGREELFTNKCVLIFPAHFSDISDIVPQIFM
jgi:hypothetical protein